MIVAMPAHSPSQPQERQSVIGPSGMGRVSQVAGQPSTNAHCSSVLEGGLAVVTLSAGRHKRGNLLCHEVLLQRREELLCFHQRQTEVLDTLTVLVEDRHLLHLFLTAIARTDH